MHGWEKLYIEYEEGDNIEPKRDMNGQQSPEILEGDNGTGTSLSSSIPPRRPLLPPFSLSHTYIHIGDHLKVKEAIIFELILATLVLYDLIIDIVSRVY